ncbi:MAG: hypothetical protein GDA48_08370 [Hormoscilla sp. GM102CHS1]|nr:hypothetical protein [Hormoscilla sp. GM102CHS1]
MPQLYQRILLPPAVWDFDRVFLGRSHAFSGSKAIWTTSRVYKKKTRAGGFSYSKMILLTE